jgi:anti-sigma factor RsiW
MTCRDVEKKLSAFLDGELEAGEKAAIASHARGCTACGTRLQAEKRLWNTLGALPGAAPSPYFYTRLSARLREKERSSAAGRFERILVPASALAIALFGFWLGYLAGGNGEAASQTAQAQTAPASTAYLDTFDDIPAASLGDVYFALAGQNGEAAQ